MNNLKPAKKLVFSLAILISFLPVNNLALSTTRHFGGTVRVVNRSTSVVTVSIDGNYGCQALAANEYYPEKTCQFGASTGHHMLTATNANGAVVKQECDIEEGETVVWTISNS